MNLEDKWRAEFCEMSDCTDMESRFDPCLVPEWNGYLKGRRKAQEEIDDIKACHKSQIDKLKRDNKKNQFSKKQLETLRLLVIAEIANELERLKMSSKRPLTYIKELEELRDELEKI